MKKKSIVSFFSLSQDENNHPGIGNFLSRLVVTSVFVFGFFSLVSYANPVMTAMASPADGGFCCDKSDGTGCGTFDGHFLSGVCKNKICDETCQNGWTKVSGKCMLNRHNANVDWITAKNTCESYGSLFPKVTDLDALTCNDINFRPGSNCSGEHCWGSVKTATPSSGGHATYRDRGGNVTCPDYTDCGTWGWNTNNPTGACNIGYGNLQDWRTDYGYVCLKDQNPLGDQKSNVCPSCVAEFSPDGPLTALGSSNLFFLTSNATAASYTCLAPSPKTANNISIGLSATGAGSAVFNNMNTGTETCTITVSGQGAKDTCSASIAIYGACGSNINGGNKYAANASVPSTWGVGFCSKGIASANPGFPNKGKTVSWNCSSTPCSASRSDGQICPNGDKEGTEQCDEGASGNGDCPKSCSSSCQLNNCSEEWIEVSPH